MKRTATCIWMVLALFGMLASTADKPSLQLIYNASDSAPRGWYRVTHPARFHVGDYVVARLPEQVAALAATRGYLPRSVPVLKRIAAVAGQRVCVKNGEVVIRVQQVARTLDVDFSGRPLTAWRHCRRLLAGELFLLNSSAAGSFDSRYFGPIDASFVRGIAVPLATFLSR